jgi:uncharacterized protein YwqG
MRAFLKAAVGEPGSSPPGETSATYDQVLAEMRRLAAPALHLVGSNAPAFSTIGGLPYAPRNLPWPTWKGKSLRFLAQVDLEEAARAGTPDWAPKEGRLYFFYDYERFTWGFDPKHRGSWRVLYCPAGPSTVELAAPKGLGEDAIYTSKAITFRQIVSYPGWERIKTDWRAMSDGESDRLSEMAEAEFRGQPKHQMFGFPSPVQGDEMEMECQLVSNGIYCGNGDAQDTPGARDLAAGASEWRLLLQLDSDRQAAMMWGDGGLLYFWIRESDARLGNFENVWMILQCH